MADMMLDMEVDKVVHMDGGLRMMDGKWLSACGSCDLEDKFMGPEGPPSRRIQIRKYNCCVVYRDGITNGVQPGGVRSVVMMPNFINHLHLAMATSTFICYYLYSPAETILCAFGLKFIRMYGIFFQYPST